LIIHKPNCQENETENEISKRNHPSVCIESFVKVVMPVLKDIHPFGQPVKWQQKKKHNWWNIKTISTSYFTCECETH